MKKNSGDKKRTAESRLRLKLVSSLSFVLVCAAAMFFSAYALFGDVATTDVGPLSCAVYSLEVAAGGEPTDGSYTFSSNGSVTFTLTANGNASTGYCTVETGTGEEYCTTQIPRGESVGLQISAPAGTALTFTPSWGEYGGNEATRYGGDVPIVLTPPETATGPPETATETATETAAGPPETATETATETAAGPPEAGPPEAGPPEAGPPEAGPPAAGPPEAGSPEAEPPAAEPPEAAPPAAEPPAAESPAAESPEPPVPESQTAAETAL